MTSALLWTQRGIALALLLQTIELLQLHRRFTDDGVWSWPILRAEHRALPAPLRWLLDWAMPYRTFVALLAARLLCCVALLAGGPAQVVVFLLFSQIAICVRFRGTFNGGSDYMSVQVLLALCVALSAPLQRAALIYLAVQCLLSYFQAGIVKLKEPSWRDGSALLGFLRARPAPAAQQLAAALTPAPRRRIAARAVIAFECASPLALLDPRLCTGVLALGLAFHTANAFVFGLNRFLFAWAATYPALFFCSELLGAST